MVAMRRVASASRGLMPFHMPQMFSQLSQPSPLKKAILQIVGLIAVPAVADVDHVTRLKPFVTVDHGNERELSIVPRS